MSVLTPYLALSQEWSRFDFHFQAGFDINADDTERSRARYGIGLTTQLVERVAFLIDIIGSSNLTEQDLSVTVPVIVRSGGGRQPDHHPGAAHGHRRPGGRFQGRIRTVGGRIRCRFHPAQ